MSVRHVKNCLLPCLCMLRCLCITCIIIFYFNAVCVFLCVCVCVCIGMHLPMYVCLYIWMFRCTVLIYGCSVCMYVAYCVCDFVCVCVYTGCPRRNVPDFGRVFLMLKYTDITQNTYVQSGTVTEIMAREKWILLAGPCTVPVRWQSYPFRPWV